MADDHEQPKIDAVTGIATTGHEWDGLTELNQPLPRWWLWIFYANIVFAVGYWVVYPSWPLITNAAGGVFGWHSRTAVVEDLDALRAQRGPMVAKLTAAPLTEVKADAGLFDFTLAYGRAAFGDNCAPCHGPGGGGAKGYPNLIDDDWLWGGTIEAIQQTITYGVRNENPDSRQSEMPAFGRDGILTARRDLRRRQLCSLALRTGGAGGRRSRGRQADLCRQLRRLPRRGRQGQSRVRRAQPDRRGLALRLRLSMTSLRRSPTPATPRCPTGARASTRRPSRRWRSTSTPSAAANSRRPPGASGHSRRLPVDAGQVDQSRLGLGFAEARR